jgi:hypothetical protein
VDVFDGALAAAGVPHEIVIPRRPAFVLRPQAGRLRRRLGGRVGPGPRLRARAGPASP